MRCDDVGDVVETCCSKIVFDRPENGLNRPLDSLSLSHVTLASRSLGPDTRGTEMTPSAVAASMVRMAGVIPCPHHIAAGYLATAADLRRVADKAAAAKSGKHRGYTFDTATVAAERMERMAIEVPAALREMAVAL